MPSKLNPDEIDSLIKCGQILSATLTEVLESIRPGIAGDTLDKIAEKSLRRMGARPSFLNYGEKSNPFPATICLSINNEVVHGIPLNNKVIREGDLVSVDIGAEYKGIYTDMAKTIIAGKPKNDQDTKLIKVTQQALKIAISMAKAGTKTGDMGEAIEKHVKSNKMNVVKALVGHGIGKKPHEEPQIPNFGERGRGETLEINTAIAIEPMVNLGMGDVVTDEDGWSVRTYDGTNSAHFEHTILITENKPKVVTL